MKNLKKYIFVSFMLTMSIIIGCPHEQDSIITIETQDGLQNLLTKCQGPIIISFHMQHCGWCKQMEPIIKDTANESKFNNICFYRADGQNLQASDDLPFRSTSHLVKQATGQDIPGYPFILFMNQGNYITKQVGGTTKKDLMNKIENAFPDNLNNILDAGCCCDQD